MLGNESNDSLTYDILKREVKAGDIVLLYNSVEYKPCLDVFHLGILVGKNKYIVYDYNKKIYDVVCNQVYLLDENDECVSEYKNQMLKSYTDYQHGLLKEEARKRNFKSSSTKHKPGELFLDKSNNCYIYLGKYNVKIYSKVGNTDIYNSSGHTYFYLHPDVLRVIREDGKRVAIEDILMCLYHRSIYDFSNLIYGLKRYSNRFIDRHEDEKYEITDSEKEITVESMIRNYNGYCTNIIINMKPLE